METSLLDRVKTAGSNGPAPVGLPLEDVQHNHCADVLPETAAGHDEHEALKDAGMEALRRYEDEFADVLPRHVPPRKFLAAVRNVLPDVRDCTPASVLQSLLTCARFGLLPDGHQAVIKAEGKRAVFIPTYHGYIDLFYRSGRVDSVVVGLIHENDVWHYEPSAPVPDDFMHRPAVHLPKAQRGPAILAYAFCRTKGGGRSHVIVLSREDAEEIRDEYSQAYQRAEKSGKRNSFWHTRFLDMWLKTAVRRMAKYVPLSTEVRMLAESDDAGDEGTSQILHAPDPESAALEAEAGQAAKAAEASQDQPPVPRLPVKKGRGKAKPRRRNRDRNRR
ncbi:recombinase RecT [Streptomyces sp. NPDC004728]|uniref:recombinase RecT n=1 Tax=Streptomyces sp. NPDC004728 TaxID=3154289 RepID=UPI0033B750A9